MLDDDAVTSVRHSLMRLRLSGDDGRRALAATLGLTDTEFLALERIAAAGSMRPGTLAAALNLSSGGATALVHRLERLRAVVRSADPNDRRSVLLHVASEISDRVRQLNETHLEAIDGVTAGLDRRGQQIVSEHLGQLAELSERHAEQLRLAARSDSALAANREPLPLWA